MLSINGVYDGEKIIIKEPIDLEKGKHFRVIITFLETIEENEELDLSEFCGIWQDSRSAEEIVDEIYKQRKNFSLREIKM